MKPYRILVTGSREGIPLEIVEQMLAKVCTGVPKNQPIVVVHGNAQGVDFYAKMWARKAFGVEEEPHQAKWRLPGGALDRAAGHKRNALMVSLGADVCIAFIAPCTKTECAKKKPHGSHGATSCARMAKSAGIRVLGWKP
jgi:hypothetical protein